MSDKLQFVESLNNRQTKVCRTSLVAAFAAVTKKSVVRGACLTDWDAVVGAATYFGKCESHPGYVRF